MLALLPLLALAADPWLSIPGTAGPGKGKTVVLISGDEEYRSEESMPAMARILAERHGFQCTVLFSVNKQTGEIDPSVDDNIPGLEALKDADLMVVFTRYRHLPEDQMAKFVEYVESGRPVIGVRTATLGADGHVTLDYALLDEDLDLLKGATILFQVGHPPITYPDGTSDTVKHAAELDFFYQWRDHLIEHGVDFGQYAFYINDEPGLDFGKSIPNYLEVAQLFREADPRFRIYVDPVPSLAWDDFQKLFPYVDVWCPNMRLVNGLLCKDPRIEAIMHSGKPVWSYECVAQVKSLSPLLYNRAKGWRAYYFGLSGIGTWTFSTTSRDHWLPGKAKDEEYALVYPGPRPVRSVRCSPTVGWPPAAATCIEFTRRTIASASSMFTPACL